ncbi:MAG: DUF1501 domain-containing protein [Gemmataceae bacterium]
MVPSGRGDAVFTEVSPGVRSRKEDPKTRERYGRTTYGQSCLLARRLAEAGAKFVNVYFPDRSAARETAGTITDLTRKA